MKSLGTFPQNRIEFESIHEKVVLNRFDLITSFVNTTLIW